MLLEFPQAQRRDVALNEELYFHFSDPLDRASINDGTVQITDLGGHAVRGEFLTRDPRMVVFVPELPTASDLRNGGFRPATHYQVTLAGFPRVDGIRATGGEILSQSLVFWFETASEEEDETLFFGFAGSHARLELDPKAHGLLREMGTLDPVRLVVEAGVDPSTLVASDFELWHLLPRGAYQDSESIQRRRIDVDVQIVENQRDRAVIELLPRTDAPGVWAPLEAGQYFLICGLVRSNRMSLRTLGGGLVLEASWELRVRERLGKLFIDFSETDRLFSGRPEGSDATARWGGPDSGVSIRFPRSAGDGRMGNLAFGTRDPVHDDHPEWRIRQSTSGGLAHNEESGTIHIDSRGLDIHAERLSISDGTTVHLEDEGGVCILRSQGPIVIRGELKRTTGAGRLPETSGRNRVRPSLELEESMDLDPADHAALSGWLERAKAADEDLTILIAGCELEVYGQIDVEGTLILIAGGEVRLPGSIISPLCWQTKNSTHVPMKEGLRILPLALDPPETNPLKAPLIYSVQSRIFGPPGGVSAWGSANTDGSVGTGARRVSFFGQRLRGGVLERIGLVNSLTSLQDCQEIGFRVDLEIGPAEGEPWQPPRLDSLELSWSQRPRGSTGP